MNPIALTASGYCYHNGKKTVKEFTEFFGFSPLQFPHYFRVTRTNLVVALQRFYSDCDTHFCDVKQNMDMLVGRIHVSA